MGHMGIERTLDLVRNRFYWPRMANDVQTKVKSLNLPVYTLRPENAGKPLRTLHRDLLLPCGYLSAASQVRPVPVKKPVQQVLPDLDPEVEVSSDDDEIFPIH